ncbi:aspartic peptidase domain-containing protein [Thamnidium elegans]|nr:aspartic peptidase domain-containing protein [Thamnidium elegans]
MKYILSVAILALTNISPIVNALPGAYSPSYTAGYSEAPAVTSIPSVDFACGYEEENWVIKSGFGNPEQSANLLIDSTFGSIFVAGVMCHSDFCEGQSSPLYNAGKSSTSVNLHKKEIFNLGDERIVKGDLYRDDITAGSIKLHSEMFAKAFSVEGFPSHPNYAGAFGLNPIVDSSDYTDKITYNSAPGYSYSNILERADNVNRSSSTFSKAVDVRERKKDKKDVNKDDNQNSNKRSYNSEMCTFSLGIDYTLVYKIGWLSLPTCEYGKSPFWKTDLECVKINGVVDLKFTNTLAEFDTTVKDIHVPHGDFEKIHQGLKATYNDHIKKYVFKCCDARDLEISFKDHKVTLPVEDWTIKIDRLGDHCAAKIAVSNTTEVPVSRWRLGTDFMENFYTIFDRERAQTGLGLYHGQDPSYLT